MDIEDLLAHAGRFDSAFAQRIVGAEPSDISRLESVVTRVSGLSLPAYYRTYLERLGNNDGGLRPKSRYASMRIRNIIEYYEDVERESNAADMIPRGCIVVAYTGVGLFDLSLSMANGGEPTVLVSSANEVKGQYAESLEKMLHRIVFDRLRVGGLRFMQSYRVSDPTIGIAELKDLTQKLGFQSEWFSDPIAECAVRDQLCVSMERGISPHSVVIFAGSDQRQISGAVAEIKDRVPIELQSQRQSGGSL